MQGLKILIVDDWELDVQCTREKVPDLDVHAGAIVTTITDSTGVVDLTLTAALSLKLEISRLAARNDKTGHNQVMNCIARI